MQNHNEKASLDSVPSVIGQIFVEKVPSFAEGSVLGPLFGISTDRLHARPFERAPLSELFIQNSLRFLFKKHNGIPEKLN